MWNQTTGVTSEVGVGGVTTSVDVSGFLGGVSYGHWLEEYLSITIYIGGMAADVSTSTGVSGVATETSVIASILMGVKVYFPKSTYTSSVRPYASAGVGPFTGSQSSTKVGMSVTVESRSETAFGGQLGAGVDFILGRHFMTGFAVRYNLMTDFNQPIGGSRNYSGPEFSFGFSYLFGKGVN
jgi:outer membrane protein W